MGQVSENVHVTPCEVAIITGTLGVGKTETSWSVIEMIMPAAMIDIDYLCAFAPKDPSDDLQKDHVYKAVILLLKHHQRLGFQRFVINGILETPADLALLYKHLQIVTNRLKAYRLVCRLDEVRRRIRNRNEPNWQDQVHRSMQLSDVLDAASKVADMGTEINTTGYTIQQAAARVIKEMQSCGFWLAVDSQKTMHAVPDILTF